MAMEFEHESFAQQEDSVHNKIEELLATLIAAVTGARAKEPPDPVTSWSLPPSVTQAPMGVNPFTVPRLRLEPPRFDGQNAAEWIRRMQIYYNHNYTPLSDRLYLTQYLFDPPASDWMADWTGNNPGKGWEDFLVAVYHHFTPEFLDGDSHMVVDVHQYETIVDAPNEVTLGSSIPDAAPVFCSIEDVSCDTISDEYNIGVDTTMGRHILGELQPGDFADIEAVEHHHSARGLKVEELSIVVDLPVVQGSLESNRADACQAGDTALVALKVEQPTGAYHHFALELFDGDSQMVEHVHQTKVFVDARKAIGLESSLLKSATELGCTNIVNDAGSLPDFGEIPIDTIPVEHSDETRDMAMESQPKRGNFLNEDKCAKENLVDVFEDKDEQHTLVSVGYRDLFRREQALAFDNRSIPPRNVTLSLGRHSNMDWRPLLSRRTYLFSSFGSLLQICTAAPRFPDYDSAKVVIVVRRGIDMPYYTSYLDEGDAFQSEFTGAEGWNKRRFSVMVVDRGGCEGGIVDSWRDSKTNALGMPNQDCELSMGASIFGKNLYSGAVQIKLCSHTLLNSSLFSCYSNSDLSGPISKVFYAIFESSLVAYTFFISRYFKDGDQRATETFGAVLSKQVCGYIAFFPKVEPLIAGEQILTASWYDMVDPFCLLFFALGVPHVRVMVRRLVLDIIGSAIIRQDRLESAVRPQKMYSPRIVFLVTYFGGNFYIEWSALVGVLGDDSNWQVEARHIRRVQFMLIRFSTKGGVKIGRVEELIFVCCTYCFSGQMLRGLMRVHLTQIATSTTVAVIQMMCDVEDVYDHPLREGDIIHSSSVIISKDQIKLGEFNGDEQRSSTFDLWKNLANVRMPFDPIDVVLEKTWSCGGSKKFISFGVFSGHIRRHSIELTRKASSIVEYGESLSTLENFGLIRRESFMGIYMSIVNLLFSCVSASHCGISKLDEADGVARCLVLLHKAHLDEIGDVDGSNFNERINWVAAVSSEFEWVVLNIIEAAGRDLGYMLQRFQAPPTKSTGIEENTSGTPSIKTDPTIKQVFAWEELEVQIALGRASLDARHSAAEEAYVVCDNLCVASQTLEHGVIKLIVCCIFIISALRTRRLLSGRELIGTSSPKPKRPTKPWPDIFYC